MQLIHQLEADAGFERSEIAEVGLSIRRDAAGVLALAPAERPHPDDVARVVPFAEHGVRRAALIAAPGIRDLLLGGRRPLDVQVLAERDEIALGGARLYFTARVPLVVTRCEDDASCGVCGEGVRGCDAVTCTHCSAVTHAGALLDGEERDCFAHRGCCPGCGLARGDFEWLPEIEPGECGRGDGGRG